MDLDSWLRLEHANNRVGGILGCIICTLFVYNSRKSYAETVNSSRKKELKGDNLVARFCCAICLWLLIMAEVGVVDLLCPWETVFAGLPGNGECCM